MGLLIGSKVVAIPYYEPWSPFVHLPAVIPGDMPLNGGAVAQLVEQWTENPCVGGSIPSRATLAKPL